MTTTSPTTPHPNLERARRGYDAFARSDIDALLALLATDVVWHVGGDGPLSGAHRGPAEVAILMGKLFEHTAGSQRLDVLDIFADDDHVVSVIHETATRARDGAVIDVREAHVLQMGADGKVTEFWDVPDDPAAHDAFFA